MVKSSFSAACCFSEGKFARASFLSLYNVMKCIHLLKCVGFCSSVCSFISECEIQWRWIFYNSFLNHIFLHEPSGYVCRTCSVTNLWSRSLFEKLIVAQPINELFVFFETKRFIIVFTGIRLDICSSHPLRSVLVLLTSNLRLDPSTIYKAMISWIKWSCKLKIKSNEVRLFLVHQ